MTTFEETLKSLNLDANASAELGNWISNASLSTKIPADKIKEIFTDKTSEAVAAGLADLGIDMFLEFVKTHVTTELVTILPPPPGIPINFLPFGYYGAKSRTTGNKTEPFSEIIGFGKMADTGVSITTIMAYGVDAMLKRNSIDPFHEYPTVIAHNSEKRTANLIRGSIHKDTVFDGNSKSSVFPATQHDVYKIVLGNFPIIPLSAANSNISKLLQSDKGRGGKSKPYPDSTDLKVIQVRIADVQSGRRKDGAEWMALKVVDSTFMPQTNHKHFNVWIDPALARKVGAGTGSFVKIMGTLEHDMNQQFVEMNACAIIPDKIVPLVETVNNLGGNAPGMLPTMPAASGKVIDISL